jgi:hypothetical protein
VARVIEIHPSPQTTPSYGGLGRAQAKLVFFLIPIIGEKENAKARRQVTVKGNEV